MQQKPHPPKDASTTRGPALPDSLLRKTAAWQDSGGSAAAPAASLPRARQGGSEAAEGDRWDGLS
jgi:hypothetical protein